MKTSYSANRIKDNKENDEKVMITSKYNWWMGERQKRRMMDLNVKSSWPRKTRLNDVNL